MTPVDQFSALADATRCRVIELLHQRPMPVHELTAAFDISRPAISRHLRVLKDARLVKEEKQGRENVYSLQRQRLKPMAQWLGKLEPPAKVAAATKVAATTAAAIVAVVPAEPKAIKPVRKAVVVSPPQPKPQMQLDLF
jgi:DNA-binding transcriptional ArsR family regulator